MDAASSETAVRTGRLLYALVKKGFRVDGLDLNPKAVEFCNARFRRHGVRESAFVADMSDFKTKWKCDLAFNTINSFRHLCSEREARGHLQCMGEVVRPGGPTSEIRKAASSGLAFDLISIARRTVSGSLTSWYCEATPPSK